MEKTGAGTGVGVDDPYDHVDRCDYLADDGRCRFAVEHGDRDPAFARERRREDYRCPVAGDPETSGPTGPWEWADCPHFRCRDHDRECARCGLEEVRLAHDDERPLLEEHHLSYADSGHRPAGDAADASGTTARSSDATDAPGGVADTDRDLPAHEITVYLCRWCHAKVHGSWARIDDDVSPDPEAIAERESRRAREQSELDFESAADRFDGE